MKRLMDSLDFSHMWPAEKKMAVRLDDRANVLRQKVMELDGAIRGIEKWFKDMEKEIAERTSQSTSTEESE